MDLSVVLGKSSISVEELMFLSAKDTIILNQSIEQPLVLQVDKVPKFYVQPGKKKNRLAVQILEEIKGGDFNDE